MKKAFRLIRILVLAVCVVFTATVFSDRAALREGVVRLHVVAASDSARDQQIKLQVRDAVLTFLQQELQGVSDAETVREYIQDNLPRIQSAANQALDMLGAAEEAVVSFAREAFSEKEYETFRLPSGVYDSLRITIGSGEGANWWCVIFPSICSSAAAFQVKDTAVGAGFSGPLAGAITRENGYELRFFCLDALGKLENFFHRS